MARRIKEVTVQAAGRDKGKTFILEEMPASKAEAWATRALLALSRSGANMPTEYMGGGMAAVAAVGLQAFMGLQYDEVKPLMDEMFQCITFKMPATGAGRTLVEEDIEEVATRAYLRLEVFSLHVGFSVADELSKLKLRAQSAKDGSTNTSTSPT